MPHIYYNLLKYNRGDVKPFTVGHTRNAYLFEIQNAVIYRNTKGERFAERNRTASATLPIAFRMAVGLPGIIICLDLV